jgi:hypothetical protein
MSFYDYTFGLCIPPQVSLLHIGQQGLRHFFGYRPLLEDCENFTPMPEKNDQCSANHF